MPRVKSMESESDYQSQDMSFKAMLDAQPKVRVRIPKDSMNKDSHTVVGINGVFYYIPNGEPYEVPESVFKVLEDSHRI